MPTDISIRERIVRQVALTLATVPGVNDVHRWDADHEGSYETGDIIVAPAAETIVDWAMGNPGTVLCTLPIVVSVLLFPDETAVTSSDELRTRWQKAVQDVLMGNRTVLESTAPTERLARDSRCEENAEAAFVDGAINAAVLYTVEYEHPADNPYSFGTLITLVQE